MVMASSVIVFEARVSGQTRGRSTEKSLFGKKRKVKIREEKVREPRAVTKAKRTQEKKQEKLKKDYTNYVDDSKKRSYKIQTPEVQARMKQNQKDIKTREKSRKKKTSSVTRSGRKKYKN